MAARLFVDRDDTRVIDSKMKMSERKYWTQHNKDVELRQKFSQDGTPVLGVILNDWIPGLNGYGYDSKYYDRYAKYYNVKKD